MTDEHDTDEPSGGRARPLLGGRALTAVAALAVGVILAVVLVARSADDGTADREVAATSPQAGGSAASVPPTPGPTPAPRGEVSVAAEPTGTAGGLTVTVADPATPTAAGATARHCLLVTYDGAPGVGAYGCHDATTGATSTLRLSEPGQADVGCAATATRAPAEAGTPSPTSSNFTVTPAGKLPAGTHTVTVTAVTGTGDGCPPADEGGAEHVGSLTTTVTVG